MNFDRAFADAEIHRDYLVGGAASDPFKNLVFALGDKSVTKKFLGW